MLEALTVLGEAMKADAAIPKDLSGGFDGVYLEPAQEECGLYFVTYRFVHWRANTYLIGMGELTFDIGVYDTDPARLIETMNHIMSMYPIPLVNPDGLVGLDYRIDELHFTDSRLISKPKLTARGGGVHHLPIQAYAVIKPVGST